MADAPAPGGPPTDVNEEFAQAYSRAQEAEPQTDQPEPTPPPQPQVDYSKAFDEGFDPSQLPEELAPAYKQMQADYTRKTQDIAEERKFIEALQSDPETQQAVFTHLAEQLGYDLEDPQQAQQFAQDVSEGDTPPPMDPRVDALIEQIEADRQEREQQEYVHAIEQHFATETSRIAKEIGRQLPEQHQDALLRIATSLPPDDNGLPPVAQAWQELKAILDLEQQQYLQSKKGAPAPPNAGTEGSEVEKFDTPEARTDAFMRAMERASETT